MDMTRYEKIDGVDALRRLADGDTIYESVDSSYFIKPCPNELWSRLGAHLTEVDLRISELLNKEFYIKKPFDVRQAMRDKPDEWVGAFFDEDSESWRKVGFDFKNFKAVEVSIKDDVVTDFYKYGVSGALQEELDACIPLDEVPEDAR